MAARLFLWPNQALVLGASLDSQRHAHFAAQLSFGLQAPFQARLGDGDWVSTRAALFAPNQIHQLDSAGGSLAHVFVVLPAGHGQIASSLDAGFARHPDFASVQQGLLELQALPAASTPAQTILQTWLACAFPTLFSELLPKLAPKRNDARIAHALHFIDSQLHDPHLAAQKISSAATGALSLPELTAQLAQQLHLSASRLTHLFRAETGMSLSGYLLWARLQQAVQMMAAGHSITQAAHHSGFADTAHLSRSFRRMIGITPSELQKMTMAFKP